MNEKKLIQENELLKQTLKECEDMCMTLLNYIQATNREIARIEKHKPIYEHYECKRDYESNETLNLIKLCNMHELMFYSDYEIVNIVQCLIYDNNVLNGNNHYHFRYHFHFSILERFTLSYDTKKAIITVIPSIKKIYIVELL